MAKNKPKMNISIRMLIISMDAHRENIEEHCAVVAPFHGAVASHLNATRNTDTTHHELISTAMTHEALTKVLIGVSCINKGSVALLAVPRVRT